MDNNMEIYKEMSKAKDDGRDAALITVVNTSGSTPRKPGTKMLCFADGGIFGTIGGGVVERSAIADAINCILEKTTLLKTYNQTDDKKEQNGMVCGVNVTVFIEPCFSRPKLYLCGAGHVAAAILPIAKSLGFYITLIDPRDPKDIEELIAIADTFINIPDFSEVKNLDIAQGGYFVVCTFLHKYDGIVLEAALNKRAAYVGMLGAKPKIKAIYKELREKGVTQADLDEIYAPLGLDIGSENPAEIALSAMAEIIAVMRGKKGGFFRDIIREELKNEEAQKDQ